METILSVENLQTTFFTPRGAVRAIDGVSFALREKETLGIVGESGCGKSLTSLSILGLVGHPGRVTGGQVLYRGVDLLTLDQEALRKIRGHKIAMIFQEPAAALNPVLTIGEQIAEQILAHETLSKSAAHDRAVSLLHMVGIPSPAQRSRDYPHQLSGGMRQRAMIAMALSLNPDILIADEPTTALDVTIQAQILDLLQNLQDQFKMAMIFITHDLGVISELSDRLLVMYGGKIVEEAPTEILLSEPKHPYTLGLINSIPRFDQHQARLPTIPGSVPSLSAWPNGCRFQNRCVFRQEKCGEVSPPLEAIDKNHRIACFYRGNRT